MSISLLQDLLNALTLRDMRGAGQSGAGNGKAASLEELRHECGRLLASDGEASSISLARSVFELYARLPESGHVGFFHSLLADFSADRPAVDRAIETYRADPSREEPLRDLFEACEPPRQELLRRLNLAPGGTAELVRMRTSLLRLLRNDPALTPVDEDFRHLFASWFNRGFLVLRRIDWNTSAAILEKLIEYEAVHEIADWQDLRRRLDPRDRRCFGFFHPALGDEPLIFVEVALTKSIPSCIQNILHADHGAGTPEHARTAAFFGISNCQFGLRGISFGNFLIKQVVQELKQELPNLETFVTLSPVPGFWRWVEEAKSAESEAVPLAEAQRATLTKLDDEGWWRDHGDDAGLRDTVRTLAARYLTKAKNNEGMPQNPVARFHLGNGARLERINWLGDISDKGLRQGVGLMVNYVYDLDEIERNHEQFVSDGTIAMSSAVRKLVRQNRSSGRATP